MSDSETATTTPEKATGGRQAPAAATAPPTPSTPADDAPPASSEAETLDALIRKWVEDHIHNGPIARASDCYEALHHALPALRDRLLSR